MSPHGTDSTARPAGGCQKPTSPAGCERNATPHRGGSAGAPREPGPWGEGPPQRPAGPAQRRPEARPRGGVSVPGRSRPEPRAAVTISQEGPQEFPQAQSPPGCPHSGHGGGKGPEGGEWGGAGRSLAAAPSRAVQRPGSPRRHRAGPALPTVRGDSPRAAPRDAAAAALPPSRAPPGAPRRPGAPPPRAAALSGAPPAAPFGARPRQLGASHRQGPAGRAEGLTPGRGQRWGWARVRGRAGGRQHRGSGARPRRSLTCPPQPPPHGQPRSVYSGNGGSSTGRRRRGRQRGRAEPRVTAGRGRREGEGGVE